MKEYLGTNADKFEQTKGKLLVLNPHIQDLIKPYKNKKVIDVGCGDGYFSQFFNSEKYLGVDFSKGMINKARINNPKATFIQLNSTKLHEKLAKESFELALLIMLFPGFKTLDLMLATLFSVKRVLTKGAKVIIAVPNPYFDKYMQKYLFNDSEVYTDFKGYFKSGSNIKIKHLLNNSPFIFNDYHWTLEDYSNIVSKTGFCIDKIIDCNPKDFPKESEYILSKRIYPTYMILICKVNNL